MIGGNGKLVAMHPVVKQHVLKRMAEGRFDSLGISFDQSFPNIMQILRIIAHESLVIAEAQENLRHITFRRAEGWLKNEGISSQDSKNNGERTEQLVQTDENRSRL